MSIAALLQAAEYLERREREIEHGYATTMPPHPKEHLRKKQHRHKLKKNQGTRTSHNELEKNRRAHLRNCLETLKQMVPLGPQISRHTTLGLLTKAKSFIKNLEEKELKQLIQKEQLLREQRFLKRRLEQLGIPSNSHKRRSISECSSSTSVSTNSSSLSETDEVDIMGYNSNQSDTDDHSSIQSITSDGGVSISTKRLSLGSTTVSI